jgi:hypothetical protein
LGFADLDRPGEITEASGAERKKIIHDTKNANEEDRFFAKNHCERLACFRSVHAIVSRGRSSGH